MVIIDIASRIDNEGKATQGSRGAPYRAVVWAVVRRGLMAVSEQGRETGQPPIRARTGELCATNGNRETVPFWRFGFAYRVD